MNTPSPRAIWRQTLRAAIRAELDDASNPGRAAAQAALNGRLVNTLTIRELLEIGALLSVDTARPADCPPVPDSQDTPDMSPAAPDDTVPDLMVPPTDSATSADAATIEQEVDAIRRDIMGGGFASLDQKLRDLVVAAHKPPVVQIVKEIVQATPGQDLTTPQASPTGETVTWKQAFGVKGPAGATTATLWDGAHPDTPTVKADYVWPAETIVALTQIKRHRNVYLFGPAGCGKTEFAQQIAARLRRPFILISCDASTDASTLVGMTVPDKSGSGVTFQPGQLVRAIQTPGAVICIDEPSVARPGALFVLQNVLTANRALYIQETGTRVPVAPGVIFMATDNTSGMGGGARRGFHGTGALNSATLDRFGARIKLGWHDARTEAGIIMAAVPGCTRELADLLVQAATTTRAAADAQTLTLGLGLRRLFAWAELLTDGIDPETAFLCAVQHCVPEAEQETLRQQCLLAVDKNTVRAALNPGAAPLAPAAGDFDPV